MGEVDNSAQRGTIEITGAVTDAASGAPIPGVVVEITSGANLTAHQTTAEGAYTLTASVPGGEGGGSVSGMDFALPVQSQLSLELVPAQTELAADGQSATEITLQVHDREGRPVQDRTFDLTVEGKVGPGTIQPAQATTDENGLIRATYTAFQLAPDPEPNHPRHEILIRAADQKTGDAAVGSVFVSQYQLTVLRETHTSPPAIAARLQPA